jgi:alpha-tubulin suppressor-like RCC1 family protein
MVKPGKRARLLRLASAAVWSSLLQGGAAVEVPRSLENPLDFSASSSEGFTLAHPSEIGRYRNHRPGQAGRRIVAVNRIQAIALVTLLGTQSVGCEIAGEPTEHQPGTVLLVEVAPSAYTFTALGDTVRFGAVLVTAAGDTVSVDRFQWSSSNESVATVDTAGLATAVGPGTGQIMAEARGVSGEASLAVEVFPSVSTGWTHTCGVRISGDAYCWGGNESGQLGDGTKTDRHAPVPVSGGLDFAMVSAGSHHTCGVTSAGDAYCWGFNRDGQLGDGTITDGHAPVAVSGGLSFVTVSTGFHYSCGVTTEGSAYCWGRNMSGQLGDGSGTDHTTPVPVSGGLSFVAVSAGEAHACGLTTGGSAHCWGDNFFGQLGDNTTNQSPVPVQVLGGLSFAALSAGGHHTCGVTTGRSAYCWGRNSYGQLGDSTTIEWHVPAPVSRDFGFTAVSAGGHHSCGITYRNAYCWGNNSDGQLGIGGGTWRDWRSPRLVSGGLGFVAVRAGEAHACGVTPSGDIYCWGLNDHGQLGDGTTTDRSAPLRVVW